MKSELPHKIEAILFWKAEPVEAGRLAKLLNASVDDVIGAARELAGALAGRGIALIETTAGSETNDIVFELRTAPEMSSLIEQLTREELIRDVGKAGLETLAIVLYKSPVTRREIDYIRGVNSQFILRNLLMRRLVERQPSPNDQRSFVYVPTPDLLGYLGITTIEQLPDFESYRTKIVEIERMGAEVKSDVPSSQTTP